MRSATQPYCNTFEYGCVSLRMRFFSQNFGTIKRILPGSSSPSHRADYWRHMRTRLGQGPSFCFTAMVVVSYPLGQPATNVISMHHQTYSLEFKSVLR